MRPYPNYGTKEFPVHKSDFVNPCPAATNHMISAREDKLPTPVTTRMLQGTAVDITLQLALNTEATARGANVMSQARIREVYEWLMIYLGLGNFFYEDSIEAVTTIEEAIYNYMRSYPPSVETGWPFEAIAGFCQCEFLYPHTCDGMELWFAGKIDRVEISGAEVFMLDWKLGKASPFCAIEGLIYKRASAFPMKAEKLILHNQEGQPYFETKLQSIELHKPASRFFQVGIKDFVRYKRPTKTGKKVGDYKGKRFYECNLNNETFIDGAIASAVRTIRNGDTWVADGIHCHRCSWKYRCDFAQQVDDLEESAQLPGIEIYSEGEEE